MNNSMSLSKNDMTFFKTHFRDIFVIDPNEKPKDGKRKFWVLKKNKSEGLLINDIMVEEMMFEV